MDWSLPGSSIYGIFQARVLEWGPIAFSDLAYMWGQKQTQAHRVKEQTGCCSDEVGRGNGHEMGEGGQKLQTSSYKINKLWGCNVQHDGYS